MNYTIVPLDHNILETSLASFLETLSVLSDPGAITLEQTQQILQKTIVQDGHVFVALTDDQKVIGTIKVQLEQKFQRQGAISANIEEVVTNPRHQGKGIGSALMNHAIAFAKEAGAYKIVLDCKDTMVGYYARFGFEEGGTCMKYYC